MKILNIYLILLFFSGIASLEASYLSGFKAEAKFSAFLPSSKVMREIYSDVLPCYEIEVAKQLCQNWNLSFGAGVITDEGRAIGCRSKTNFELIPLNLSIKYLYPIGSCVNLYAGVGACWSFLFNKDHSHFVHQNIFSNALGGVFKCGFYCPLKSCVYLDVFSEYLCQYFSFKHHYKSHYTVRHDLNMSGFKIGAGLGINF